MKHEPSGARLLPANPLAAGLVAGEATAEGHAALAAQLDTSIATGGRRCAGASVRQPRHRSVTKGHLAKSRAWC